MAAPAGPDVSSWKLIANSTRHCGSACARFATELAKLEKRQLTTTFKFGVLYAKAHQMTEEEMFSMWRRCIGSRAV